MVRRAVEKNIRVSYSSLEYRDLANLLLTRLVEGYGYDNKVQVARKLVNDVLELVEENTPSMDMVRPEQICWLARSVESRAGPEKDSKKVLVKLTVVGEEDREILMKGGSASDLKRLRVVRMLKEAEEQGGVLSMADVSALTGLSLGTVSRYVSSYEKSTDQVLPTRGTVHDVGSKTSHKKRIVRMYLDGYQPLEIARKTRHNVENVDRYIKDFRRVKHPCLLRFKGHFHTQGCSGGDGQPPHPGLGQEGVLQRPSLCRDRGGDRQGPSWADGYQPHLCTSLSRIVGRYRAENQVDSWDFGSSSSCSQGLGQDGTEQGDRVTYLSRPGPPENGMGRSVVRGVGSGIVACFVAGKDRNGTIHFATPLIFSPTIDTSR